jgi:hypothetical protein
MNRIKQMTVQQLLDMGFKVEANKFNCGGDEVSVMLEARQLLGSPEFFESGYSSTTWATQENEALKVTFFGD